MRTDRRTDGHGDSSIPPNFVAGGIITNNVLTCHGPSRLGGIVHGKPLDVHSRQELG